MSRDHGKNKANRGAEFAPDCTIQFWENIWTEEAFEGSPALLTTARQLSSQYCSLEARSEEVMAD